MRGLRSKLNLLHDSDFGIVDKKEISKMADFVKNNKRNNNGKRNNNRNNSRPFNKDRNYSSRKEGIVTLPEMCGELFEYKMSREMADNIVKEYKGKRAPQEVLCEYVNTQCGLKGYCVKVLIG